MASPSSNSDTIMTPMLKSALVLGEFIATVGLAAGLIVADAVLLSYGIARVINWMIDKWRANEKETVIVLGYEEAGDWGPSRTMTREPQSEQGNEYE